MESFSNHTRQHRGHDVNPSAGRRGTFKNRTWVSGDRSGSSSPFQAGHLGGADAMRWERGGGIRGGGGGLGRGRGRGKGRSPRPDFGSLPRTEDVSEVEDETTDVGVIVVAAADGAEVGPGDEPVLETREEREQFYQELVKAREVERKRAIAEGRMDDPLVPKRLDEAITMVGTCMDMCPRFERYRRERENNLFNWEVIPGTKRVDHQRAVKMYERAAGDKTLPSDLRPPPVLKRTLDYLFRELLHKEGFSPTFDFIRDRSRAVRSDFTMQHETGQLAIECHERCARFHILALHFERDRTGFSVALEEQQLMNTLQSLKEFYEDQRGRCELPNELEMRIYHRLIHIRDQRERHDDIPDTILTHPVFLLTTKFRQHVQAKSSPITKFSPLIVTEEGMLQFAELAALLREQGNRVMVYLVACILERLFGKDTIEEIEAIRDGIVVPDIIDGVLSVEELDDAVADADAELIDYDEEEAFLREDEPVVEEPEEPDEPQHQHQSKPLKPSATEWLTNNFGVRPSPSVMLDGLGSGSSTSAFTSAFGSNIPAPPTSMAPSSVPPATSAFANLKTSLNVFGNRNFGSNSVFGVSSSTPGVVNEAGVQGQTVRDSTTKPSASLSPFVASTSTSAFGSPFARSAAFASTSQIPNAAGVVASSPFTFSTSQSAPSGFPAGRRLPDTGLGVDTTPPTSTGPGFSEKHGQSSSPSVTGLNAKASAFTPGQQFGVPLSTSTVPVNDEKKEKSTTGFFNASSSSPTSATASTRPILPPINTSPLSSTSTSNPVTTHLATSQSAPSLNGSTKRPSLPNNLEPQPTLVDGFETLEENHSPQHPPPLKVQPISLPGTPTATSASTSFSFPPKQKSTNNLFGWPSAQSTSAPEILSPLVLSSRNSFASLPSPSVSARPSLSRFPSLAESPTPTGQSGPSQDTASELPSSKEPPKHRKSPPSPQDVEMTSPISAPLRNGKGKGKGKAKTPVVDVDDLEAKASSFARTSAPVRDAFKRWADKASERILYNNAVRRSDAYTGRKTKKRQDPRSRANTASDHESEAKASARRTRRRVSAKYTAPQTDAELARRLKENHEQHERRWAPGTFLAALRAHVGNPVPFDYSLWLSLNPENDGTAIWVEKKFDVPNSGAWVSERVFSIPLAPGVESRSPGLVVFECSPLDGVDDEIEKKFRILDDCARLREVIETFPEDRHFISSVLFILWGENDVVALSDDLRLMTDDYEAKGVIGSHATFSLSSKTKDLDEKFTQVLSSMNLDTAGGLVEILSRQEFLLLVVAPWKEFALDWVTRCSLDGEVDWTLFAKVFETLVKLMNKLSLHFTTRLDESATSDPLPEIRLDGVKSSSELYDAAFVWLEHKDLRTPSREFRTLLQSYRTSNADFPVYAFVDALHDLSVRCIEGSVKVDRAVRYSVPKCDIKETEGEVENEVSEAGGQLRAVFLLHTRHKRPPPDDDEASVLSMSPSSKRLKSTFSSFPTIDDLAHSSSNEPIPPPSVAVSPSTSVTTIVNEEKPQKVITVAMLRALSQSVLQNRGRT